MRFNRVLVMSLLLVSAACSGDATTETPVDSAPAVGQPDPALPPTINSIPFKPGDLAALGNAQISIAVESQIADESGLYRIDVRVISGALEDFTITPEMFRLYTLDGASYTPVATGGIPQFGNATLEPEEVYEGTMAVLIPTDSPPAMFVANLSGISDRFFPGAWVLDPNFEPVSSEG